MFAFLLPIDLDLCLHPQTDLSFGGCNLESDGNPHSMIFKKKVHHPGCT